MLTMLGGGILRLVPELMHLINRKLDNSHELALMERQIELEKLHLVSSKNQMDGNQMLALLEAQKSALAGQMQKTGVAMIDAVNFLVRPVYAYWALGLYSVVKVSMIFAAWPHISLVYTEEDFALLSGIASFYFVGRAFDKKK